MTWYVVQCMVAELRRIQLVPTTPFLSNMMVEGLLDSDIGLAKALVVDIHATKMTWLLSRCHAEWYDMSFFGGAGLGTRFECLTQSKAIFVILKDTCVLETDSCIGACGVYSYTNESA
jgi:hypothetical protein